MHQKAVKGQTFMYEWLLVKYNLTNEIMMENKNGY